MKKDEYIYTVFQEDDDNAERFKIMYYVIPRFYVQSTHITL